ncbi:hypothetical protein [Bradyrhizobium betae]|uniref:hypothetical protein n=1 Tax=Bradyrhizobium betae TaxID=244734 RepID=UPI0012B69CCB|nr:hypothetical protein [Bradyrhizobium betae]MCS3726247.1 hypothetical protein [Bradyrhizobium betae]
MGIFTRNASIRMLIRKEAAGVAKNPRPMNGRGSRDPKLCQYIRGQSNVISIAAA